MASDTYSAACGSALSGQSRDCERELTLAEKLAVHHYRGHAALQRATARGNAPGEEAGAQRAEAGESKNRASLACLSVVLQELTCSKHLSHAFDHSALREAQRSFKARSVRRTPHKEMIVDGGIPHVRC